MKKIFFYLLCLFFIGCSKDNGEISEEGKNALKYNALSCSDIADWTEVVFAANGDVLCRKDNPSTNLPEQVFAILNTDNTSVEMYSLSFYGDGLLKTMRTDKFFLKVLNYHEDSFDVLVFLPNNVSLFYSGLKISNASPLTRGWGNDNWVRKTCNVLNVIVSAVGIATGVTAVILAPGVLPGVIGVATIIASGASLSNSLGAFNNSYVGNVSTLASLVTSYKIFGDNKYSAPLAIISGGITIVDTLWGDTLEYEERQEQIKELLSNQFSIINSIEVGTVGAKCTALLKKYSSSQEVGFCYSSLNSQPNIENDHAQLANVQVVGDNFVLSSELTDLWQGTLYYYRPFITSLDRSLIAYGPIKSFVTKKCITGIATAISDTEYVCYGEVEWSENNLKDVRYGICYSDVQISPDIYNANVIYSDNKDENGAFSVPINHLKINKRYYYRSFLIVNGICYYGDTKEIQNHDIYGTWEITYDSIYNQSLDGGKPWIHVEKYPGEFITLNEDFSGVWMTPDDNDIFSYIYNENYLIFRYAAYDEEDKYNIEKFEGDSLVLVLKENNDDYFYQKIILKRKESED